MKWGNRWLGTLISLAITAGLIVPTMLIAAPPHVVVILADDLGFSDLGCYGSEIATPQLDALAAAGIRYSQFYNTARCWPTRAALLTGYYPHQIGRDTWPDTKLATRPAWAPLLPAHLRQWGYRCYHSGKWHIDGPVLASGFERSYCLNDHDRHFQPRHHQRNDQPLPPVEPGAEYYSTTAIADEAIAALRDHAQQTPRQPLFLYVAFTAPHFPLQAPAEVVAQYRQRYQVGWDVLRDNRWNSPTRPLLVAATSLPVREANQGPPYHFPDAMAQLGAGEINRELAWSELTPVQQAFQAEKMAIHAAMVDRLDHAVGRIFDQLKAMQVWENTLLLFLSDNGASAEIMVRGDGHDGAVPAGSHGSFLCLGPGWSRTANTPFRRHKTWVHEGGIASPLLVHWPQGIPADRQGSICDTVGHVIDIAPTLCEIIQRATAVEGEPHAAAAWPPDANAPARPGISLRATLTDATVPSRERPPLWWLHEGNRALRDGRWKLVASRDTPWELYDMATDRTETQNLAAQQPDRTQQMATQWQALNDAFRQVAAPPRTKP